MPFHAVIPARHIELMEPAVGHHEVLQPEHSPLSDFFVRALAADVCFCPY